MAQFFENFAVKRSLFLLGVLTLASHTGANAAPVQTKSTEIAPIYGGEFTQLDRGPIAIILTDSFQCSGVLVGEREVLTAAHCVTGSDTSSIPNDGYTVIAGGQINRVRSRAFNREYNPSNDVESTAPYDLAVLLLEEPITTTAPLPVLTDDPVEAGESAMIFGYGANEISGMLKQDPWDNAKQGEIVVTDSSGGLISSSHLTGGASTCAGDSGGPSIQQIGGSPAVIGVLSIGVNRVSFGNCVLVGNGFFSYVDLQSATSTAFLDQFPGIQRFSPRTAYVRSVTQSLLTKVQNLVSDGSLSQVKKTTKSNVTTIRSLIPYADDTRATLLASALKALRAAKRTRSIAEARKGLKKALLDLQAVIKMGVA